MEHLLWCLDFDTDCANNGSIWLLSIQEVIAGQFTTNCFGVKVDGLLLRASQDRARD